MMEGVGGTRLVMVICILACNILILPQLSTAFDTVQDVPSSQILDTIESNRNHEITIQIDDKKGQVNDYTSEDPLATFPVWINASCVNLTNVLIIEIDGFNRSTPAYNNWDAGSTHYIKVYTESRPDGCYYCNFTHWEDGSTDLTRTIVVNGPMDILGHFIDYYNIMVNAEGQPFHSFGVSLNYSESDMILYGGRVGNWISGDLIIVFARPGIRTIYTNPIQQSAATFKYYEFKHWTVYDANSTYNTTTNPTAFTVGQCTGGHAYFEIIMVDVHIIAVGPDPIPLLVGYDGHSLAPSPVSFRDENNEVHTLRTTTPQVLNGTKYEFVGWQTGPTTIDWQVILSPSPTEEYFAEFIPTFHYVTIEAHKHCDGIISPISGWYPAGAIVSIQWLPPSALPPGERYIFWGWAGSGQDSYTGRNTSATIVVNSPITETVQCFHVGRIDVTIQSYGIELQTEGADENIMGVRWRIRSLDFTTPTVVS